MADGVRSYDSPPTRSLSQSYGHDEYRENGERDRKRQVLPLPLLGVDSFVFWGVFWLLLTVRCFLYLNSRGVDLFSLRSSSLLFFSGLFVCNWKSSAFFFWIVPVCLTRGILSGQEEAYSVLLCLRFSNFIVFTALTCHIFFPAWVGSCKLSTSRDCRIEQAWHK